MRVLVTGASGFIGQSVCSKLLRQGFLVRGALRKNNEFQNGIELNVVGEINGVTEWGNALAEVDIVIHLAARVHIINDVAVEPLAEFRQVNVLGTESLARQAVRAGVRRLVYVSSIKVNGEETEGALSYSERDVAVPRDPYGISKWEAEQVLHRVAKETGLEVVIVRPPLVYGSGVKGNFVQMLSVLSKGVPLPLSLVKNRRSLIYVENLADALILCATHPAADGQTYLLSDGDDVSTPDLLRQLGAAMGRPARLFPCHSVLLKLAGHLFGKSEQIERLLGSLRIDSGKIRRELNWHPPYTLQEGLRKTGESFVARLKN